MAPFTAHRALQALDNYIGAPPRFDRANSKADAGLHSHGEINRSVVSFVAGWTHILLFRDRMAPSVIMVTLSTAEGTPIASGKKCPAQSQEY